MKDATKVNRMIVAAWKLGWNTAQIAKHLSGQGFKIPGSKDVPEWYVDNRVMGHLNRIWASKNRWNYVDRRGIC